MSSRGHDDDGSPLGLRDDFGGEAGGYYDDDRPPCHVRWRLVDWLLCLVVLAGFEALGHYGPVHCRGFIWDDPHLSYPYRPNTVPTAALVPVAAGPVLLYAASSLAFPIGAVRGMTAMDECVALALMQLRSIALNALMTEPTKLLAGNLRPDFIARLNRAGVPPPADRREFVYMCNVTNAEVVEGRKSFPSGHTSTSFAAMVPLALFIVRRAGAFGHGRGSSWRLLLGAPFLAVAFGIGISRNRDEWHHFVDITAGAVIGIFAGLLAYRLSMEPIPAADRHVRDGGSVADDRPIPAVAPRREPPVL